MDEDQESGTFQVPFSKDELQESVVVVLLGIVRQLHFLFPDARRHQLELLGLPVEPEGLGSINDPDCSSKDLRLEYRHVAESGLAEAMDRLYDFAFASVLDVDVEDGDMNSEGGASWCSRILYDLARSAFVAEWDEYACDKPSQHVSRCLLVCETAQARRVLEGMDDNFMDWHGASRDGLSIRQLSLLSNMTEASLRTMTNSKRKFPLTTQSDGRNVYVLIADARAWLMAKGRYLPIRRINREGRLDLTKHRYATLDALQASVAQRGQHLACTLGFSEFAGRLRNIAGVKLDQSWPDTPVLNVPDEVLLNPQLANALADALDLPGELLILRAREAHAAETLRAAQDDIQRLLSR